MCGITTRKIFDFRKHYFQFCATPQVDLQSHHLLATIKNIKIFIIPPPTPIKFLYAVCA